MPLRRFERGVDSCLAGTINVAAVYQVLSGDRLSNTPSPMLQIQRMDLLNCRHHEL